VEVAIFTNVPGQSVFRERLVQKLLSYCKENLPEDLVPRALVVVDDLPDKLPDISLLQFLVSTKDPLT
jgi:hypothetical protein